MGRVLAFTMTLVVVKIFFPELTDTTAQFMARVLEIMLAGLEALDEVFSSPSIR